MSEIVFTVLSRRVIFKAYLLTGSSTIVQEGIIILPAVKGNAPVVFNTANYIQKMTNFVEFLERRITEKNLTTYLEKKTKYFINSSKSSQIYTGHLVTHGAHTNIYFLI